MNELVDIGRVRLNVVSRGSGPPLLLAHGFPLDHTMWQGQLSGLSEGRQVITPDLRGFGKSDATDGTLSMDQLADDLAALLDTLQINEPIALAGLSMGGYVAFEFWRRHTARLSHLILMDTRAAADSAEAAQNRLDSAERVMLEGTDFLADGMVPKLFSATTRHAQPDLVDATNDVILDTSPRTVAAVQRGMAQRHDMTALLSEIQVPTLVLCGEDDGISPPSEMRGIAESMPQARFIEIAQAGHLAPLEQPEATNEAVRDFLLK